MYISGMKKQKNEKKPTQKQMNFWENHIENTKRSYQKNKSAYK